MEDLQNNPIVLILMAVIALGVGFWILKWILVVGFISLKQVLKLVLTFFLPFNFSE